MGDWSFLIDQTLAYQQQSVVADAGGGAIQSWATVIAAVPVAIQPPSTKIVNQFLQRQIEISFAIYTTMELQTLVPGGIVAGDRLTDGTKWYRIEGWRRDQNFVLSDEPLYCLPCSVLTPR